MYIHRLEGNWFRHPFWQARFVLDDPVRLQALRDSTVPWVLIDPARGADVVERPVDHRPAHPQTARSDGAGHAPAGRRAAELSREILRAERLTRQVGKAVSRVFLEARLGKQIATRDVAVVVEEIYASIQRNIYAFNGLLRCQSDQINVYRHALAASALMVALARRMGLSPGATRAAGMVGLLMDTGLAQLCDEAGVCDYRDLTEAQARDHVLLGLTLLRAAGDIPPDVLTGCLQHHERLDGSGYPYALQDAAVGQLGRMAAVCDAFDHRMEGLHDAPVDPAHALAAIAAQPELYDQGIVERLVEAVGVYPIGSFVRLRSGRLAMVVDQDDTDIALPVVRVFAAETNGELVRMRPTTLALGQSYGQDAIEGIADIAAARLPPIDVLRRELMSGAIAASGRGSGP